MNRSADARLRKLESASDEQKGSFIVACDRAEADVKLKLYKGDQPPKVILTGVPRDNMAGLVRRVSEHGRLIHERASE